MHNVEIGADIVARVVARRGRLHLFDALDPARTAFVIVDMQNAFCEPGAPVEVPAARGIVPAINRLAGELRRLGGTVIWVRAVVDDRAGMDNWGSYLNVVLGDAAKLDAFIDYIGSGGRAPNCGASSTSAPTTSRSPRAATAPWPPAPPTCCGRSGCAASTTC